MLSYLKSYLAGLTMCDDTGTKSSRRHAYGRSFLYTTTSPCRFAIECIRRLGLKAACRVHRAHVRRYRGRRSGRPRRSSPVFRDAENGAAVIIGNWPVRTFTFHTSTFHDHVCPSSSTCRSTLNVCR